MSDISLPTGKEMAQRIRLLGAGVALPSALVVILYVEAMLTLSSRQWVGVLVGAGLFGVVAGSFIEILRKRYYAPVRVYLDARREEKPSSQVCREAFAASVSMPSKVMRLNGLCWLSAGPLIVLFAWLLGLGQWEIDSRLLVLTLGAALGGIVSSAFNFFGTKHLLSDVRMSLAADLPDPAERAAMVSLLPLAYKMQAVVLGVVVGVSLLTISLSYSQSTAAIETTVMDWQARVLEHLEFRLDDLDIGQAVSEIYPMQSMLPYSTDFIVADLTSLEGEDEAVIALSPFILEAMAEGERRGRIPGRSELGSAVWRALDDREVMISVIRERAEAASYKSFYVYMTLAAVLSSAIALAVAWLFAADFRRAVESLRSEAERMAQGDLRRGRTWEAEDEMGLLARSFERMGGALRATVGRVAEAADRVDSAASEIASVSQGVAIASADQVRRIQQASELTIQIKDQVAGVSHSAQALNISVEESSSSILELGAAGDELNDTASVLTAKVDEVSGSIEQMVRSVKQVASTTDGLSEAAEETSSSMEEMASAMRAVDNTAELTADLSRDVVKLAVSGQEKVSQTIEGMDAIRDATDAAEDVIRGLGSRAKEIGGILVVIDDVADETSLLALNAAIIAAQAGEHGRAFSVVADEIKELADRVLASTKEIGALITSVQDESERAVGAIERGSMSVASGVERSAEAGTALEEITRAAKESGTRISNIVTAVREQTKATIHVVNLMEGVRDGVSQISVAGAEQDKGNEVVYRSAVTMREVAQQVHRTTEEQARGFGRIRESVEGVREAVETINSSLTEQTEACSQVASFLEQVAEGTRSNEEAAQRMGQSMHSLVDQAEALRDDVAKFQI
jgi:methyl-accepting chemotaxis protein